MKRGLFLLTTLARRLALWAWGKPQQPRSLPPPRLRRVRRVYIAAPKAEVMRALDMAALLESYGLEVVSRWHDIVKPGDLDPADYSDARALLEANLADLRSADAVLSLTCPCHGRGVYTEIGRALERGLPVVWSLEREGRSIDWTDPRVLLAWSDESAVETLCAMSRVGAAA